MPPTQLRDITRRYREQSWFSQRGQCHEREILQGSINPILSVQADQVCGADYATTSASRTNVRNGNRHRDLDTRVGTIDVAVPKLRSGSFFPDWLLERRTRAKRALTTVIATCFLTGVSLRRMNDLVASLKINNPSKSQVSDVAKDLDLMVEDFRTRTLDTGHTCMSHVTH